MSQHYEARDNQGLVGLFYQGQLLKQQDVGQILPIPEGTSSTSWVGGGCALNGIDLFCPWQKSKDNTENPTAEKLCCKFIHVSRTREHLGHSHWRSIMTQESMFSNLPLRKNLRHHTNKRKAMSTFFLTPCRTSTEFYFANINLLFYTRSAFVSLKTH